MTHSPLETTEAAASVPSPKEASFKRVKAIVDAELSSKGPVDPNRFGREYAAFTPDDHLAFTRILEKEMVNGKRAAVTESVGQKVSRKARTLLGTIIPSVAPGPSLGAKADQLWHIRAANSLAADNNEATPQKAELLRKLIVDGVITWKESLTIKFISDGPSRVSAEDRVPPEWPEMWHALELSVHESDEETAAFVRANMKEAYAKFNTALKENDAKM